MKLLMIANNILSARKLALAALLLAGCFFLPAALGGAQQADITAAWRPQIHFYAPPDWINDPNGPILLNGQYNLFFQLNPLGDEWGHMSWGHAVSTDLIHWKRLPTAIPEGNGISIFSGSTVADAGNTSGLCGPAGTPAPDCIIAIYAGASPNLQTQNLAWSRDGGMTWTRFAGNPVIDLGLSDFRDPKVFWHAPTQSWVMVVALSTQHKIRIYRSPNLRQWTLASDFGPAGAVSGVWECPDLFELPVFDPAGKRDGSRWLLSVNVGAGGPAGGGADQYFIGKFDGSHFVEDHPGSGPHWADWGKDFYASTSLVNGPAGPDGIADRLWLAWMANWEYAGKLPSLPGRGEMTIFRRLFLHEPPLYPPPTPSEEPLLLVQQPVLPGPVYKPYTALWGAPRFLTIAQANAQLARDKLPGHAYRLRFDLDPGEASQAGVRICASSGPPAEETLVGIDTSSSRIFVDRTHSGRTDWSPQFPVRVSAPLKHPQSASIPIEIVVDNSSVEVFAENGETVLTDLIYPSAGSQGISFFSTVTPPGSAPARIRNVKIVSFDQLSTQP